MTFTLTSSSGGPCPGTIILAQNGIHAGMSESRVAQKNSAVLFDATVASSPLLTSSS